MLNNSSLSVLSGKPSLKLAHLNIRSLPGNFDEVQSMLIRHPIDIMASCETRLDDVISDDEVHVHNFHTYRKDRNRNGGGVLVYVNNSNVTH